MPEPATGGAVDPRSRRRISAAQLVVGVALGAIAALVVVFVAAWMLRDPLPRLSVERLDQAWRVWKERGPESYDLDLVLSGGPSSRIHVEVRDGAVTAMTRDGRTPNQRRTWDYWSVENQLATLEQELASAAAPQRAFGVTGSESVVLRAEFDLKYGYPKVYHRVVLGRASELRWEVISFVPVDLTGEGSSPPSVPRSP